MANGRSGAIRIVAVAMIALFSTTLLAGCQESEDEAGIYGVLQDGGYDGSLDDWLESLTEEEKASIDIAYESSVSSGYKGSKETWVAEKLQAHYNNSNDLVVTMPDGGEFTVSRSVSSSQQDSSNASTVSDGAKDASGSRLEDSKTGVESQSSAESQVFPQEETPGDSEDDENKSTAEPTVVDSAWPILIADSIDVQAGDENAVVAVRIKNNPGILGMTLSVSYDEAAMELISAENGEMCDGVLSLTRSRTLGTGCVFTWDGVEVLPDDIQDGEILRLYFDISKDAVAGNYPIVLRSASAFTNSLEEANISIQNGSVAVA